MECSFRELECFTAVAEELSFTRAARRLNLAQPPLSRHIRALEERIGTQLFVREPRRISLTPAGRVFHEETRDIASRMARAVEMTKRCAAGENRRLRLGFVSAVMSPGMVEKLRKYREKNPDVQILLHDLSPQDQLRAISEGKLDGGFVGIEPTDADHIAGIRFVPYAREPLVCLLPHGHRLSNKSSLALEELSAEPFVTVSGKSAPAYFRLLRELCATAGFSPRVVIESTRAQAVTAMVGAGSGVAILPRALAALMEGAVIAVPLKRVQPIIHVFAVATGNPAEALEDFTRFLAPRVKQ